MPKKFKLTIENEKYEIEENQLLELFNPWAIELCYKVRRQGGSIKLGVGAFRHELREQLLNS